MKIYKNYLIVIVGGGILIDGSLTSGEIIIPNDVTAIGINAFKGYTNLKSITIFDSVTSIGNYAFCNCTGLTSINIPESVTTIGYSSFENCTGLISVNVSKGVESINSRAFYGCIGLKSIYIPSTVITIAGSSSKDSTLTFNKLGAFYKNYQLKIYCEASEKQTGWEMY